MYLVAGLTYNYLEYYFKYLYRTEVFVSNKCLPLVRSRIYLITDVFAGNIGLNSIAMPILLKACSTKAITCNHKPF